MCKTISENEVNLNMGVHEFVNGSGVTFGVGIPELSSCSYLHTLIFTRYILNSTFLVDDSLLRVSECLNLVEGVLQSVLSGAEMCLRAQLIRGGRV